jgi:hypothetical protein
MKIIHTFAVELSKPEARGIKKVYQDMLELLNSPERWIQDEETDTLEKEDGTKIPQFCLIGALHEVDGDFESLAKAFMLANPPKNWTFDHRDVKDLDSAAERAANEIPDFNDHHSTKYKEVTSWLQELVKKTDEIITKKK